jgi:hypothetical protein
MPAGRLGKFSFLWPVVSNTNQNNNYSPIKTDDTKRTTEEIANERSALNSEFRERSIAGNETHPTKRLSIINKNLNKTPETTNNNLEISSKTVNSSIVSDELKSDSLIKNASILSDIEDKEIANELIISKNIEAEKLIAPIDDDDDFFIINKELRDNYLTKNIIKKEKIENELMKDSSIDKVNELKVVDEEEEEENNNKLKSIIILNGEKPVVTTFSFFNTEPNAVSQNNDQDQFESIKITYV